jgi:hypothetical protein
VSDVLRRLHEVRERVEAACARSRRDPRSVRLVAVSKTVPVERIREAMAGGQTLFGENRVQEALAKIDDTGPGAHWHLVGRLQTNKAKHAAGVFELIHAVDGRLLAVELDRRAAAKGTRQAVLVQANLAGEPTKAGAGEAELLPLVEEVSKLTHLVLCGLMIIPPQEQDQEKTRLWFRRLRELRDLAVSRLGRPLPELSMGMTDDFEVAIGEGATIVRIGRALFGPRT